ncbi:extensin-like protein [Hasllibacter halocynthiae]|uniref:Extensin-like protein n=1 Tax=Hasllibacter halocynthiae TaxID=595589 RepID=A0A2T0X0Z3_9RHOB|nr:extensin family protein [Hasllibacter halocynthiae]PRY92622.1 extensin-like protein [Hasllibacter halocynthiae]
MRALALVALLALAGCGQAEAPDASPRPEGRAGVFGFLPLGGERERTLPPGLFGRPGLIGQRIDPIPGRGRCGIAIAYRVTGAGGAVLSPPARIAEPTARAFDRWMRDVAQPAFDGQIAQVRVAASYACRGRNNRAGARLSEHSFGNAIDISAFVLRDGRTVTLLDGWNGADGAALREMWQGACGIFGTVLGPESDRHHRDHFHFDVAGYRSGAYCR